VEYYLPAEHILFFETQDEQVYAHTARDVYRIKRRLYELERELPRVFVRVSKSAIVNTARIYSVTRDFTGFSSVSQAHFRDTQKTIYISRRYAATLRDALGAY
jgi:DNA-binding LytR/AlgR family response regulator